MGYLKKKTRKNHVKTVGNLKNNQMSQDYRVIISARRWTAWIIRSIWIRTVIRTDEAEPKIRILNPKSEP